MTCDRCQAEMVVLRSDCLLRLCCAHCGHTVQGAADGRPLSPDPINTRTFLVGVVWASGRPTATEVAAVRRLFPELALRSLAALLREWRTSPRWSAGAYPMWRWLELREAATEAGVTLEAMELV